MPLLHIGSGLTNYPIIRRSLASVLTVCWRVLSLFRGGGSKAQLPESPKEQRLKERQSQLRAMLRRFPWWSRGHLYLGVTELELAAEVADKGAASRGLAAARLSAEAIIALEGSPHTVAGTWVEGIVLGARAIQGLVLVRHQQFADALAILKHVLALNNAHRLPTDIRNAALEAAATSAYFNGDGGLALEFFARVPPDALTQEGRATLNALRAAALEH